MKCPRCQHENRPQAKFCEECGIPCQGASPTAVSNAEPKSEVENLRRALSEALEQQMATGEILRVIASSPSDVRPVFDTILDNATRLCEAHRGGLFLFDGEAYHAAAFRGAASALVEHHTRAPIRPGPHTALARVLRELRPVHIDDVLADAAFAEGDPLRRAVVELEGMRTLLMVPLLKEGRLAGALAVHRREVRPFTDRQMELLQTFAAQAVIAIENVRLSNETKRGAGAADRHGRDPAGDRELADRAPARDGRRGRKRCAILRGAGYFHLAPGRRVASARCDPGTPACVNLDRRDHRSKPSRRGRTRSA
jgi:GAF domain-containing protein